MKELMIKISKNNLKTIHTQRELVIDVKYYYARITKNTKAYLSDGKSVYGYAIIKDIVINDLITKIILTSFIEFESHLLIEDFNVRSNRKLLKMTLDVMSVTRRSEFEENLSHFIDYCGLSVKSSKAYRLDIRQFLVYLSDYSKSINDKDIVIEYQYYLEKMKLKNVSIQRKMITIKRFLHFEGLNNLDKQICIVNKTNKKVRIINLYNYEIKNKNKF